MGTSEDGMALKAAGSRGIKFLVVAYVQVV